LKAYIVANSMQYQSIIVLGDDDFYSFCSFL